VVAKSNISGSPMNRSFSESENCFGCDGEEKHFWQDSNSLSQSFYRQLSHSKYFVRENTRLTSYKMYVQGNNSEAFVMFLNLYSIKFIFSHGRTVLNVKCIDIFYHNIFRSDKFSTISARDAHRRKTCRFSRNFSLYPFGSNRTWNMSTKFIKLHKRKI